MPDVLSSATVKNLARHVGFHDCGVATATALPLFDATLHAWLASGCHADMDYMARNTDLRADPRLLFPGARSVIALLFAYKPDHLVQGPHRIAQYAYGDDYHLVVKQMLFSLIALVQKIDPAFVAKPCVDTVPISDKLWAVQAGLGWIGRNTLLIHPRYGSLCFLAELVTTSPFDHYDHPIPNACASCRRCLDACPSHALCSLPAPSSPDPSSVHSHVPSASVPTSFPDPAPSSPRFPALDARRCQSYHTIENRDPAAPIIPGYAFGCDRCQLACPYNQSAPVSFHLTPERQQLLESLPAADETAFRRFAKRSALSRIRFPQWLRNVGRLNPPSLLP